MSLSFVCSCCGTTVYNVEMKSERRFLDKKVCSKSCQYSICQKNMINKNPMKNIKIAKKVGQTQKKRHNKNTTMWKEKYRKAKFKHWIDLANGINTGYQKHNTNCTSIDFFIKLKNEMNWLLDEDYFESNPYEFPLIVSEKYMICFFPDYYNKTKNIIIEWDERYHKSNKIKIKDKRRDSLIKNKFPDIKIIRLPENNFSSYEERFKFIKNILNA